jgi:Fe-S-cluster-containing dehydrogenase component
MPFMTRNAIVIDLNRCIGCFSCELSCKTENDIALGEYWSKVNIVGLAGEFPNIEQYWLPAMCQQCASAPCVSVCPTTASYRDKNNVVLVDKSKCIGCKYCMMACPYGVRAWNELEKCVEKCTLCGQLTANGGLPACVKACCGEARFYGDLDNPESDASKALKAADPADVHHLNDVGNSPSTAYILSPKYAAWKSGE